MASAVERVRTAYETLRRVQRPELWITLLDESDALRQATEIDRRVEAGDVLPLAGMVGAVKDNIDVAGMATTAGCPAYRYVPQHSATSVQKLVEAGLVIMGKTNLDQFATGLVGNRSPYGAVASLSDPSRIGGGSSSGSALAVAFGVVDIALGTDTAGSGRVPAAFNSIVGIKPTRGLISGSGVVPACPSLDCVSIFARDVATAHLALTKMVGEDQKDPFSRQWTTPIRRSFSTRPIVGIATGASLEGVDVDRLALYAAFVAHLEELGMIVRPIDVRPLLAAGHRLYDGGFVSERYASVGAFVDAHRDEVDPVVGAIISRSKEIAAHVLAGDRYEIARAQKYTEKLFQDVDLMVLPTTGEHPTFVEVDGDPEGVNTRLGQFTNFCNLLDLAAVALPMPTGDLRSLPSGVTFGVTLFGPAFEDQNLAQTAAEILGEPPLPLFGPQSARVVVVGAHLQNEPLNFQLTDRGARLVEMTTTADCYRLYALATDPPKPGLVRVPKGNGRQLQVEVWEIAPEGFAEMVNLVASPLAIGPIELSNGSTLPGFLLAASDPRTELTDITDFGGWRAYRAADALNVS